MAKQIVVKVKLPAHPGDDPTVADAFDTHTVVQHIPAKAFTYMKKNAMAEAFFAAAWDPIMDEWDIGSPSSREW